MGCLVPFGRNGCVGCVGCALPLVVTALSLLGALVLGWNHSHLPPPQAAFLTSPSHNNSPAL